MTQLQVDRSDIKLPVPIEINIRRQQELASDIKVSHGTGISPSYVDAKVLSYTYFQNGNLESVSGTSGVRNYEYDKLNRSTREVGLIPATEDRIYDRNGNVSSITTGGVTDNYSSQLNLNRLASDPQDAVTYYANGSRVFSY